MNAIYLFIATLIISVFFLAGSAQAQVTVSGSTGANGTYLRLGLAFTAINGQTQTGNNIVITITASTTETGTATLNAGAWTTLIIYPTSSGLSISGSFVGAIIDLNDADNVTIDGRVNQSGNKDLIIQHTSNVDNTNRTIRFINSAENNTVQYCIIKGCCPSSGAGVIFFSTASAGNGNDNNVIDNCDITNGGTRPYNAIYSSGTASRENSGNTISNNNFFNHHRTTGDSFGINLSSNSTNFTISGNSFYEETDLTFTANANQIRPITMYNLSGVVTITGNYIGGKSAQCGGNAKKLNGNGFSLSYNPIYITASKTSVSNITNNTIKNIDYSGTSNWYPFYGILYSGKGNITGNVIGASTGTESIKISANHNSNIVLSNGIYVTLPDVADNPVYIQNNTIGAITTYNTFSENEGHDFRGIRIGGGVAATTCYAENNLIGSTSTANSIVCNNSGATTDIQNLHGIYAEATGTLYIRNNTIANLNNKKPWSTGLTHGISFLSAANGEISGNTIRDLKCAAPNTITASVIGINHTATGTTPNVFGNTIYNLENTYTSGANVFVTGIYFQGPTAASTSNIYNNFVHSLRINSGNTNTGARLTGIEINNTGTAGGGTSTVRNVYNNIVSIGNSVDNNCQFAGIYETNSAARTNNIYFNTVYIGGSPNGNTLTNALSINGTSGTRNIRNNIFVNARSSTGGNGNHYAAYFGNTTGLTVNYNNYYTPGTGGTLGYYNSGDKTSLPIVTGQDGNSKNVNPLFVDPDANGTEAGDFKSTSNDLKGAGVTIAGFTTDFNGYTRPAPPSIGGIENDNPLPVELSAFTASVKSNDVKLKWTTISEINNSGFDIERSPAENNIWSKIGYVQGKGTVNTPTNYTFEDRKLQTGKYKYRLKQIDVNGNYEYFVLNGEAEIGVPIKYNLSQNYPNPFNPTTKIDFELPFDSKVSILLYDISGREVMTLINDLKPAGYYTIQMNGSNLASGVYFYRITAGAFSGIKRMLLIK